MEPDIDEFDPDGDIILVLRDLSSAFAVWDKSQDLPTVEAEPALKVEEPAEPDPFEEPPEPLPFEEPPEPFEELAEPLEESVDDEPGEPTFADGHAPTDEPIDPVHANGLPRVKQPESMNDESMSTEAERSPHISVGMRVSSRHLILASSYFRGMLKGDWKESNDLQSRRSSPIEVKENWDSAAFRILMDIIHSRTRKVPKSISLEMLAKIAVLVDYYDCLEVVEIYSNIWIEHLKGKQPTTYCRDTMLWICISWLFQQPVLFQAATNAASKHSRGRVQTMELPIPDRIIRSIDQQREDSLQRTITALHKLLDELRKGRHSCSFACSSMLLGALSKQLDERKLLSPQPATPFFGFSVSALAESVRSMFTPEWCSITEKYSYHSRCLPHDCKLDHRLGPIIETEEKCMKGLTLEQYLAPNLHIDE